MNNGISIKYSISVSCEEMAILVIEWAKFYGFIRESISRKVMRVISWYVTGCSHAATTVRQTQKCSTERNKAHCQKKNQLPPQIVKQTYLLMFTHDLISHIHQPYRAIPALLWCIDTYINMLKFHHQIFCIFHVRLLTYLLWKWKLY